MRLACTKIKRHNKKRAIREAALKVIRNYLFTLELD